MIKYLENENFVDLVSSGLYLVDFYADWCGPCKMLTPVLEQIDNIEIIKVNTDINNDLAMKYGVMTIPTLIWFKNGVDIHKEIGYKTKEEIDSITKEHL